MRKLLESEGWAVTRGAGSHGCADLWAAKLEKYAPDWRFEVQATYLRLVQVKTDKSSPWANFRPKERRELSALAAQTGGIAELLHWPANGKPTWYQERDWPQTPNREP